MSMKEFRALVRKFDGWIEGSVARFPNVYQKQQFESALAAARAA